MPELNIIQSKTILREEFGNLISPKKESDQGYRCRVT